MSGKTFLLALGAGLCLRLVVGLSPVAVLAWVAPVPLLLLALRRPGRGPLWLAGVVGASVNLPYYHLLLSVPVTVAVVLGQAALWAFVAATTARWLHRTGSTWAALVYPVLWVAIDTLQAHLLPDGNWNSLAYSQADWLPMLQVVALLGVPGLLFLLTLVPALLAAWLGFGRALRHGRAATACAGLLLAGALGFGAWRMQQPLTGPRVVFGLASVDNSIGLHATPAYVAKIQAAYTRHVGTLAARGAQVVLLPEKLAEFAPADVSRWQRFFGALAARHRVQLTVGVALLQPAAATRNVQWLFGPDGRLAASYLKHHLAPPERDYAAGHTYAVPTLTGGHPAGLAICKDMHFASLGRAYGQRGVAVMLVPAWDFGMDARLAARTTLTRGVENGYAVVRTAREGLLSVTDAHGRVWAETPSRPLPGAALLTALPVPPPQPTPYTRLGDALGWLCVAAAAGLLAANLRRALVVPQIAGRAEAIEHE